MTYFDVCLIFHRTNPVNTLEVPLESFNEISPETSFVPRSGIQIVSMLVRICCRQSHCWQKKNNESRFCVLRWRKKTK